MKETYSLFSFDEIIMKIKYIQFYNPLFYLSIFLSFFFNSSIAQPSFSRGEQNLPITFPEAMRRADAALRAEGYVNLYNQANVIGAYKGYNTAIIMCNQAPGGGQWINIIVASAADDSGIPGRERERLQSQMNLQNLSGNSNNNRYISIDWYKSARDYRGQIGARYYFTCPVNDYPGHSLYGTDIYTDDSSLCAAAVHAGVITLAGGNISIEILESRDSYNGSTKNGLTSSGFGYWPGSFRIVK